MTPKSSSFNLTSILYILYIILLLSIVCAFRAVSSMALVAILPVSIIKTKNETGSYWNVKKDYSLFIAACIIFYLCQLSSLLYTQNMKEGLRHVQLKIVMVLVPLIFCFYWPFYKSTGTKLLTHYAFILLAGSFYCIAIAARNYFYVDHNISNFLYHQLVSPFHYHAVYYSILVFIGLAALLHNARQGVYVKNATIHFAVITCFIVFILLLSSKLVISYTIAYLLYYFIGSYKTAAINRLTTIAVFLTCIAIIGVTLFTENPISNRFRDMMNGDISLVKNEKYNPSVYFNGLQFRLLQWRFVGEILTENNAWIQGMSIGDAQKALDDKYRSNNMYLGDNPNVPGFLGYNTHNQFLESLLQTGIPGLAAYLLICWGLIKLIRKARTPMFTAITLLLIIYSFLESVFETQYGITIYTFFPLFLYKIITAPKA